MKLESFSSFLSTPDIFIFELLVQRSKELSGIVLTDLNLRGMS